MTAFGEALWDQWRDLESYTSEGTELMMSINEFMKKRADIEADYAHALQKLVKPYRDDITKKLVKAAPHTKALLDSSMGKAWQQVLNEADNIATIHFGVNDKINTELRKTIKYQSQDNEKKFKEKFDKIKKATAEFQQQVNSMEKLHDKFENDKKNMEAATAYLDKVQKNKNSTQKDIDAAKADYEKKALTASDAMAAYQKAIVETNEKKTRHFSTFLPTVLNEVQTDDENFRIRATKVALMKYYELYSSVIPMYIDGLEAMSGVFEVVSAEVDSQGLVSVMKTDDEFPPADYAFEEKALARDGNFKRPGLQKAGAHARVATEPLLDTDDDESLMSQPPKKGRKLAADRVKVFDKDIGDAEKKLQAVETLLSVCNKSTSPDPKQSSELTFQKRALEIKIDNLGLRRHRLQTYIAGIDKTALPELPLKLNGKTIQILPSASSPVSYSGGSLPSPVKDSGMEIEKKEVEKKDHRASVAGSGELNTWAAPAGKSTGKKARMIYDFQAAPGSQEVSACSGDELEVLEEQDDGWWKAKVFSKGEWKEGLIPGNYTEAL
ncbi:hypothetical protein BJ741DRAFT_591958 [Chytriomyces cf. hyalinus JEL632]|nr:hypothetical protein BJ741DRAFT_591958 [Chytriomyces cf. hyalinus JEL632]